MSDEPKKHRRRGLWRIGANDVEAYIAEAYRVPRTGSLPGSSGMRRKRTPSSQRRSAVQGR